jgi:LPXTG-motif cell wall-anchored protein
MNEVAVGVSALIMLGVVILGTIGLIIAKRRDKKK